MRQITKQAAQAFKLGHTFNKGNTQVALGTNKEGRQVFLYLFGNLIAIRNEDTKQLFITNCGYFTNTTKEGLNGIPGVSINQKAGVWYLNGVEWDGKLIENKQ